MKTLRSSRHLILYPVLAATLALGACGGDSSSRTGERGATSELALNRPFVVAIPQVGEIFDAASVLPAEISAVSFNLYDWMFDRSHDGEPRPGYAKAWSWSDDHQQLNVELRTDVVFHTGTPMTADDVAFSWERIVEGGYSSRVTRALERIEVVDDYNLRFHFDRPELSFVAVGGIPVLSRDYFEAVGPAQFRQQPVGTGPYRYGELKRGQYLELVRFENYWREQPQVERVRFAFVSEDTTRVAQLQTGEADMAMMVPFPLVPRVENDPHLETKILAPGGMTIFLALKVNNPETPWADPLVREAISLAINRDAIIDHILLGYPRHYPLLAPGDLGYDPELTPYPFDPERARELLKEAGYQDLRIELPYIAGGATGVKDTAEAVALYLSDVGIRATTRPMEGPQFIPWVMKASRNPDMDYVAIFIGGIAGRSESSNPLVAQLGGETPFAWYSDEEMYAMVAAMARIADDEARAEAIREIGRKAHADRRYIPLWTSTTVYGIKECIDFTPTLGEYDLLMLRDVNIEACGSGQSD